jgi:type II restriction enzyme
MSLVCEQAIEKSIACGKAILKYISPNDLGITGGHQKGFYLSRKSWQYFTPFEPTKGINHNHNVTVDWYFGTQTQSIVKWYGTGTRSEYRLTGFDRIRNFEALRPEKLGSLLILVPEALDHFYGYILEIDEDIETYQAYLGIEVINRWAVYDANQTQESEEDCLERRFVAFVQNINDFPPTIDFAQESKRALIECAADFMNHKTDKQLSMLVETEYALFRAVERKVYQPFLLKLFASIDEFLVTAQTVLQRRKARAGKSLEHHVAYLLESSGIPFDQQANVDDTKPDIIIPSAAAYNDKSWPDHKLFVLGIKTTCKDRWRQVTKEAPRIQHKHLLTLQEGISTNQMQEIAKANITLVVPEDRHSHFTSEGKKRLLSVELFIRHVKTAINS